MKKLFKNLLLLTVCVCILGMGWLPEKKPDIPSITPPVNTVPTVPTTPPAVKKYALTDYIWEDSDSIIGKSYIGLTPGMKAKSVKVNSTPFFYKQTWHTGSQLWYGPTLSNFSKSSEIVVVDNNNLVYSSKVTVPNTPVVLPPSGNTEKLRYHGRGNGDRPLWYGSKRLEQYKRTVTVKIDGCVTRTLTHNGIRYDVNGLLLKQSDVAGRGMAIHYKSSCKSKIAYITEH